MEKSSHEKGYSDRDMHCIPEGKQPARPDERSTFSFAFRRFQFGSIQRARNAGVNISANKTTGHDDDRQQCYQAARPLNFQEVCRSTMKGPTRPVMMWNLSQSDMRPQRANWLRLRKE